MRLFYVFLLFLACKTLDAQPFYKTDNLLLSQITKKEFRRCYKKSRNSYYKFYDGKKQSPKMDYLLAPYIIKEKIKEDYGNDYANCDDFKWGYYKLDVGSCNYQYLVIVEHPINPISYVLNEELQPDSMVIIGDGVLTKENIYFTERLYDSDETVYLNWYQISECEVKHVAELKDKSYDYRNICDSKLPSGFADDKGNYYCAIENKKTHNQIFYRINIR